MTTVAWQMHELGLKLVAEGLLRGATMPNASNHRLRFFNAALTAETSLASILASELVGYTPPSMSFSSGGSYNDTLDKYQIPIGAATINPASSLTFRTAILWFDGVSSPNTAVTADNTTNRLSGSLPTFVDASPVLLTTDSGGSLPDGVSPGQLYYAKFVSGSAELYLAPDLSVQVDFTSNGSGVRIRWGQGTPGLVGAFPANETLESGFDSPFRVDFATMTATQ